MKEPDQSGKPFSQQTPTQQTDIERHKEYSFTLQALGTNSEFKSF